MNAPPQQFPFSELTQTPGQLPAAIRAFRVLIPPGATRAYDAATSTVAYLITTTGACEIAIDDSSSFMPWDTAMAIEHDPEWPFRRITLRNPNDTMLEGTLYMGRKVQLTDRRLHALGEMRVAFPAQTTNAFEGTIDLANASWIELAAPVGSRREVWLSVERTDGDEEAPQPRAWWRAASADPARAPAREIGMALDGITRLPFSDRIEVCTDTAGAAIARIRYWLVSFVTEGVGEIPFDPEESLIIPPVTGPAGIAGIVTTNRNPGDIWKLYDNDHATTANANGGSLHNWDLNHDFGAAVPITRLEMLWGATTDMQNAPAVVSIYRSTDGANWQRIIGPGLGGGNAQKQANCTRPATPGGVIYNREFAPGELVTRYLKVQISRTFGTVSLSNDWAQAAKFGSLNIYRRD